MAKSADAFRTISEVSEALDTPAHVLRFWESKFSQVKPVKRAGGRRYYRPADIALLGGIKKLLHDDGVTIKGVQKILREKGVKYVAGTLDTLPEDPVEDLAPLVEVEVPESTASVLPFTPKTQAKAEPSEDKLTQSPEAETAPSDVAAKDAAQAPEADDSATPEADDSAAPEADVATASDADVTIAPDTDDTTAPDADDNKTLEEAQSSLPSFLTDAPAAQPTQTDNEPPRTEPEPAPLPSFLTANPAPEPEPADPREPALPGFLTEAPKPSAAQEPATPEPETSLSTPEPVPAEAEPEAAAPTHVPTALPEMREWPRMIDVARQHSGPLPEGAAQDLARLRRWLEKQIAS